MIGYANPFHHGWKLQKTGRAVNPYPRDSLAWTEFEAGVKRSAAGAAWKPPPRPSKYERRMAKERRT